MSTALATTILAQGETAESHLNHWLIGGIVLAVFLAAIIGLLSFAAGRDHS